MPAGVLLTCEMPCGMLGVQGDTATTEGAEEGGGLLLLLVVVVVVVAVAVGTFGDTDHLPP